MTLKQSIAAELRAQADGQPLQRTHIQLGGAAKFHCKTCKKDWTSKHTSLSLDLTTSGGLVRFKLFKQSCRDCVIEASPNFHDDVIRDFVTRALVKARTPRGHKAATGPHVEFKNKKPHARDLCEACIKDPDQRFH